MRLREAPFKHEQDRCCGHITKLSQYGTRIFQSLRWDIEGIFMGIQYFGTAGMKGESIDRPQKYICTSKERVRCA